MYISFEETRDEIFFKILNNINKSVEYLSLNDKNLMEANNEKMDKDQLHSSKQ
jgi:hypothetical protein